jgi:ribosomal protein S18 acetylase RimI-like enzyme
VTVRTLHGRPAVLAACRDHPYAQFAVGLAAEPTGFATDDAVLWFGDAHFGRLGHSLGPLSAVDELMGYAEAARWINMPRRPTPPDGYDIREDWDFRWIAEPVSVHHGQDRVVEVEDADALNRLLDLAMPESMLRPGSAMVRAWYGIWDAGRLVACVADRSAGSVGVLGGIAVHPEHRRHGFGSAVTAALTARLQSEYPLVALGVVAGNDAASRVYHRLGFTGLTEITSVRAATR